MRNAEQVQGLDDHVERRHQDGLGEVGGKVFIVLLEARPEPGGGLAQVFAVELDQAQAGLDLVEELVGAQAAHRNVAQQVVEALLAQREEHVTNVHHSRA